MPEISYRAGPPAASAYRWSSPRPPPYDLLVLHPRYPIRTARLTLRPFVAEDFDDLYAYHHLPEVARYLYWEPRDKAETAEALARKIGQDALVEERTSLVMAMEWRELGRVVGEVNLYWTSREHRQGEFGFVVNPEFQRRGFAAEAAVANLRLGFQELGLHRIAGRCDVRNAASAGLMERIGLRREAHLVQNEFFKGEWGDEYVYAMLADEFQARYT